MAQYTVKKGDTLKNIADKYNLEISSLVNANQIQDPNMILAGQSLIIPNANQTPIGSPVLSPEGINLYSLPEVQSSPFLEEKTVISSNKTNNGTVINYSDGTSETKIEEAPVFDTTKNIFDEKTSALTNEIKELEESIANVSKSRDEAYKESGIFDDIRKLNEQKDKLRIAQDEKDTIGIETRDLLRGTGATDATYRQYTTPQLEKAYLEEMRASRATTRLTDTINTNLAVINQQITDKYESDKFVYENKTKRLDGVLKMYSDIVSEEQKMNIENAKQANAIELKNIDFLNGMMKTAADEAIKNGANPVDISNAVKNNDLSAIYSLSGKTGMTDDKRTSIINSVTKIQGLLDNKEGLSGSVGTTALGRTKLFDSKGEFGKVNLFRNDIKNIVSEATIEYFMKVKASGATFGAMSKDEWEILAQSNPSNSLAVDRETGKSTLSEKVFKERLTEYQRVYKKAITADAMSRAGKNPEQYLRGVSGETIDSLYNEWVLPQANDFNSELSGGKVSLIEKEEGFSSKAYKDQAGVWTIGYGTTKINGQPIKQGDTISEQNAKNIALNQAVNEYSTFADKLGETNITPNQFAALNSFEYNLGSGVWNQPTGKEILRLVSLGETKKAGDLMLKFKNVKNPQTGRLEANDGLLARRKREAELLLS